MRQLVYHHVEMGQGDIQETDCCLSIPKTTIIVPGVYDDFGMKFLIRPETIKMSLDGAAFMRVVSGDHPPMGIVTKSSQVTGVFTEECIHNDGLMGSIILYKRKNTPEFLDKIRNKDPNHRDVSIGFYCDTKLETGSWNDLAYDGEIIDILYDHVAAGIPKGKCTAPQCGLGVHAQELAKGMVFGLESKNFMVTEVTDPPRNDEGRRNTDLSTQNPPPNGGTPDGEPKTPIGKMTYEQALVHAAELENQNKQLRKDFEAVKAERDELTNMHDSRVRAEYIEKLQQLSTIPLAEIIAMSTEDMKTRIEHLMTGKAAPNQSVAAFSATGDEQDPNLAPIQKFDAKKWSR